MFAVIGVGEVLDREGEAEPLPAPREIDAPAKPLHREAVEREQVLGNGERRTEERRRHAIHLRLRPHAVFTRRSLFATRPISPVNVGAVDLALASGTLS